MFYKQRPHFTFVFVTGQSCQSLNFLIVFTFPIFKYGQRNLLLVLLNLVQTAARARASCSNSTPLFA